MHKQCGVHLIKEQWEKTGWVERERSSEIKVTKEVRKYVERERLIVHASHGREQTFSFLFCHGSSSVTSCSKSHFHKNWCRCLPCPIDINSNDVSQNITC